MNALPDPIGESAAFLDFQSRLSEVAKVDRPVLIIGERGTGKEMAALRLHYLSARWDQNLVTLNCAALSPNLLEDELFGHEAGSFTGAQKRRKGRFEAANGGTLFLDEIGQTPPELQSKILRVVEYHSFERVGSSDTIEVDVRIIGATNSDLLAMAQSGKFKHDLLDRLAFEVLFIPPLRVREGDIQLLANHFAARMALELGRREMPQFGDEVIEQLEAHNWPGNVRELKNVIERAVYRNPGEIIRSIELHPFRYPFGNLSPTAVDFPCKPEVARQGSSVSGGDSDEDSTSSASFPRDQSDQWESSFVEHARDQGFRAALQEVELLLIRDALERCMGNQRRAATALGLSYDQWRGIYRKYESTLKTG
jgi:psp operon transcriptional activator